MDRTRRYRTYLVRLWPVGQDGALAWRASALDVHSGSREMFAEPAMLIDFLDDVVRRLPLDDEPVLRVDSVKLEWPIESME